MKTDSKGMLKNGIFFILILILTYIFIFSKINIKELLESLKNTNLLLILIAFILASNNITFEAINLKRNFKLLGDNVKFKTCLKYAIIGFFFSSITPATTGGQPMQIYTMSKDKIKISHGVPALFAPYICYMIIAVSLSIIGFIANYNYISGIRFFKYLVYIGLLANSLITIFVIIAMFAKKLSHKFLKFIISIIEKFDDSKAKVVNQKLLNQLDEYHKSANFIISHKFATLKTFLISFLQIVSIHSVAYFIFWALDYHEYSYLQMLLLQSVVFISVSAIPLPGTVGVSETGFAVMYNMLFPVTVVETSMLLSRGVSFYLLVIITGITLAIISLKNKVKKLK